MHYSTLILLLSAGLLDAAPVSRNETLSLPPFPTLTGFSTVPTPTVDIPKPTFTKHIESFVIPPHHEQTESFAFTFHIDTTESFLPFPEPTGFISLHARNEATPTHFTKPSGTPLVKPSEPEPSHPETPYPHPTVVPREETTHSSFPEPTPYVPTGTRLPPPPPESHSEIPKSSYTLLPKTTHVA